MRLLPVAFAATQLLHVLARAELGVSDSDMARQLFLRSARGDVAARLSAHVALPTAVTERLARLNVNVQFAQLPGLQQRALLWDAGFVLHDGRALVQVWTAGGRSMADVLVTADEWAATANGTACTTHTCGKSWQRAFACACDARAALLAKCAVADTYAVFDDALPVDAPTAVWGVGADPNAVPEPVLHEHNCRAMGGELGASARNSSGSNSAGTAASTSQEDRIIRSTSLAAVYSIYSAPIANRSVWECPYYSSFVIPCVRMTTMNSSKRGNWKEPKSSGWLDEWLIETASSLMAQESDTSGFIVRSSPPPSSSATFSSSSFSMGWLILIVLGALFVLSGVGLFLLRRKSIQREHSVRAPTAGLSLDDANLFLTPVPKVYHN